MPLEMASVRPGAAPAAGTGAGGSTSWPLVADAVFPHFDNRLGSSLVALVGGLECLVAQLQPGLVERLGLGGVELLRSAEDVRQVRGHCEIIPLGRLLGGGFPFLADVRRRGTENAGVDGNRSFPGTPAQQRVNREQEGEHQDRGRNARQVHRVSLV